MDPSASSRSTPEPRDSTSTKLHHTLFYSNDEKKHDLQLELELEKDASDFSKGDDSTAPSSVNNGSEVAVINNNKKSQQNFPAKGGLGRLEVEIMSGSRTQDQVPFYQSEPPPLISSPPLVHVCNQNDNKEGVPTMKKPTATSKADGHCSCKKSSCLKLYCDCFASESFCTQSCRCEGCRNTRDYEDMVTDSKGQIQSRMPHAFVPKIVNPVTNVNNIDRPQNIQQQDTSNMRHRVGCNCRKSMCKKKYCECYKAEVGCSSACRCEDCENPFGVKHASGEVGAAEGTSETVEVKSEMANPEQCHAGFFPATPYIQSSTLDVPYKPLAASGTSHLSSYLDSWSSPNSSTSRIEHQASGSHGAENFGSFMPPPPPQGDNIASRSLVHPSSNLFQGSDLLSANMLLVTMKKLDPEHDQEILKDSFSTMVAVKANSPNLQQLSPPHNNIQDAQSNLPPS